ncbi:hypothetical protein ACH5RR_016056 [Cinchona calisaya]|uniref:Cystatin domain-containing protein n=1 Tax=Cinchona calisaya TaxID=153742 RepID=A0ABD2ZXK7_9GENT
MALKFQYLLAILAVIFLCSDVSSAPLSGGRRGAIVGGWRKIDPNNKEVVENGKFAIDEHNEEAKTKLQYKTVVEAEEQVVSGINYKLVIQAIDGTDSNKYEAIVWVKAGAIELKQLSSFRKLD